MRFEQVVQQVDEIAAAGGLVRIKSLLEGQIDKQVCIGALFARLYDTVLEGLALFHLLLLPRGHALNGGALSYLGATSFVQFIIFAKKIKVRRFYEAIHCIDVAVFCNIYSL